MFSCVVTSSAPGSHERVREVSVIELISDRPENTGAIRSVGSISIIILTSDPSRFTKVSFLYFTLPDTSNASIKIFLLVPFNISNFTEIDSFPEVFEDPTPPPQLTFVKTNVISNVINKNFFIGESIVPEKLTLLL